MATAIPLKSPHFFKPILPGFNYRIKIPPSFIKHLDGEMYSEDHAVLRRGGKKWQVKVKNQCLENGWKKFAQENGLEIGDFVVFRHEGNMVFEVLVFDTTQCLKEFPHTFEENASAAEAKRKTLANRSLKFTPNGSMKKKQVKKNFEDRAVLELAHPHFISSLKPFNLKY